MNAKQFVIEMFTVLSYKSQINIENLKFRIKYYGFKKVFENGNFFNLMSVSFKIKKIYIILCVCMYEDFWFRTGILKTN